MFGTIRKHQTWLWAIIITLTIISFVIFFSPYTRTSQGRVRRAGTHGAINGQVITQEDYDKAYVEVLLQYFFMSGGNWLSEAERRANFDPEQRTYLRLFAIQKQEDLGIYVSSATAGQFATTMLQNMHMNPPQEFQQRVLQPHGLTMDDFDRFMRHELGIQEMIGTLGLSGKLVNTQEVKAVYIRENETLDTSAVFFSGSNYLSQIKPTPEAVGQFFTNRQALYRIPERMQVSYVKFPLSNYLATAEKEFTNLNERVDFTYQRMGTNALKDVKTPEEAKAKIRQDLIEYQGLTDARKDAVAFAAKVFDMEPIRAENLEVVAKTNGLVVQLSAPFDKDNPPKDLDIAPNFAKMAFQLTAQDPFPQPVNGRDGVYVIAFSKKLPSENPTFESIKDKVTFDYQYSEALALARKAGAEFDKTATNGLAQGKTFEAVCAEAKVTPTKLPPFALSTKELPEVESRLDIRQFKQIAFSTSPGKFSGFQPTMDGGVGLFVKSKSPPDENKIRTELPMFVTNVRRARQGEAFEAWFRKEASKALNDIPYFREKEKQQMSGRAAKS